MHSIVSTYVNMGAREEQQDHIFTASCPSSKVAFHVVCDGAGGHEGGGEASQAVVELARERWKGLLERMDSKTEQISGEEFLKLFFAEANQRVNEVGERHNGNSRAVAVALLRCDGFLFWGHVGDCRLYLISKTGKYRTIDHTLAQTLVDSGMISESELAGHPDASTVHRALGVETKLKAKFGKTEDNQLVFQYAVLCSDGFWGPLEREEGGWKPTFRQGDNLDRFVRKESERALKLAGRKADNLSVIMIELGRERIHFDAIELMYLAICILSGVLVGLLWALSRGMF